MGTFSTFFSHHIATMEGGFVTTGDEELYHVLLSLRAHGWTRNLPQENQLSNKSDDWSDYEVHQELKNADYLYENGFFWE